MPRTRFAALLLAALIATPTQAASAEESSLLDNLEGLFDAAVADFMDRYTAEDSEEARAAMLSDSRLEPRARFTPEFHAAALAHEGEPQAVPFLVWLVRHGSLSSPEVGESAIRQLLDRHAGDPGIEKLPGALFSLRDLRGLDATEASLNEALRVGRRTSLHGATLVYRGRLREQDGREELARADLEEALSLGLQDDLARQARDALARLQSPLVGNRAPSLVGPTLRGPIFDPREMAGRVVLVDFWGMWCGPCVAKLPRMQELLGRYENQGFSIIGVDSDEDQERLRKFVLDREVSWTQVLDGSTRGENARKWRVSSWPMSYLVDREGVVRHQGLNGVELETAIRRLLTEDT